jgi:hypothetical protein
MAFNKYDLLQCNIECGGGWTFLVEYILDIMVSNIQFAEYDLKNFQKYNHLDPEELSLRKEALDNAIINVPRITRVYENNGYLNVYVTHENDEIKGAIFMARFISRHICELCGNRSSLNISYERTRCRICNA